MDEPNALIRWTMFHFASGEAFFFGLGLLAFAWLVVNRSRTRRRRVWTWILTTLGFLWCGLSSTPLPFATWLMLAGWLVVSVIVERQRTATTSAAPLPRVQEVMTIFLLVLGAGLEFSHHLWSPPKQDRVERLCVIADSVTAGLNDNEDTWPKQLSQQAALEIVDASQPGATLRSAQQQAELLGDRPGLVLLEIGGNDLLEGLPPDRFEADMEKLLEAVLRPDRVVVMFELPLPPVSAPYGAIQRRLAQRFGVTLIPKRKFIALLTTSGSTVDSIHLSPRGHSAMCDLVVRLFHLPAGSGHYVRVEPPRVQR
jgi:acyl-CoA thioesterase-1